MDFRDNLCMFHRSMFATTYHCESLKTLLLFTLYERVRQIVQYLSDLHTFEAWVKYHGKEYSTSIIVYVIDL